MELSSKQLYEDLKPVFTAPRLELHPDSPVPLYYQLSRYFLQLIQDEVLKPGDRFPSEEAISGYFQVSRPTANKAVQVLLKEGWLSRHKQDKRSGTFVKEKPFLSIPFLTAGMSFADQFSPDVPIRTQIVWIKTIPATGKLAKLLRLHEGDPVSHMRRLRFAYDQPIMICDSHLSETKFPGMASGDLVENSLYKTLEVRHNCPIISSERGASASFVSDPEIIRLLGIPPCSSILVMTGVSFTYGDEPVEYLQTYLQPGVSLKNTIYRRESVEKAESRRQ